MTYEICGECLHAVSSHEPHNGLFMYCGACFRLCDKDIFKQKHKPTDIQTVMEIGARKQ